MRSESFGDVPAQGTEARFWLNANCRARESDGNYVTRGETFTRKHFDDDTGWVPIADLDIHLHENRGAIRGVGRAL